MASKRRLLRIGLQVLVILLIAGFGAFSTFLFNPFEGSYDFPLLSLAPREVDFFVAKSDLAKDFDPFPRPAFADELEESESVKALLAVLETDRRMAELGVAEALAGLDEALAQVPIGVQPLSVFGGEEIALAGFFRGSSAAEADWAVYGRASWIGKMGFELLAYPQLLGLDQQGITVTELDGGASLSGGTLPRPLFLHRIQDVLVVASAQSFLTSAGALEQSRGENSILQSAKYADHIGRLDRQGDEFELYVDYDKLAETVQLPPNWPDPYSEVFAESILGKFFQTGAIRDLVGILGFGRGVTARLHGSLATDAMTGAQKRMYRMRGFDKTRVLEVAKLAPADCGVFVLGRADVGDLLREALRSSEESLVDNLDDLARTVWGKKDASLVIEDLEAALRDRFAFVVRENDFPDEGESGPPHNDRVVPAWALVLWPEDSSKIEELREAILTRQGELGISGREPGSRGVFLNTVEGGYKVYEFWNELVDGTGHLATLELNLGSQRNYFVVSNHHMMLGAMLKSYLTGGSQWPRLADEPFFQTLVGASLPSSNLVLWLDPRAIRETTRGIARQQAEDLVTDGIDWDVERPRIERELLAEHFPGERWGALSPDVEKQLDMLYGPVAESFESDFRRERVPQLAARYERMLSASEATSETLLALGLDEKGFDLFLRVVVPFD